jgi:hypothetical protein
MEKDKNIDITLSVDSAIARANLEKTKKLINELKELLGNPEAFTKAFTGMETKVGVVQKKLESLKELLQSLGDAAPTTFVFQEFVTTITEVNTEVNILNNETKILIQNFEGIAAAGEGISEAGNKLIESADAIEKTAEKTGELKDQTEETKKAVSGLAELFENDLPDIRGQLGQLSGALEEVKTGFSAASDLAQVFGLDNKDITEAINKVTQAQAALSKAQEVAKTIEEGYAKVTNAVAAAKNALSIATKIASQGMKLFKIALASTGVGLLITGIAMLVANFDKVKETIAKVVDKFLPLKIIVNAVKNAFNFIVDVAKSVFGGFGMISKALGFLSEKFPFLKKVIDPVKAIFDKLVNVGQLLFAGFDAIKKGVQALADKFPAFGKAIDKVKKYFQDLLDFGTKVLDWLGFAPKKVEDSNKAISESNKKATDDAQKNADTQKQIEEGKTQVKIEEDNKQVESEEEKNKRLQKELEDRQKQEEDYERLRISNMADSREKSLAEEDFRYKQEQEKYKDNLKALEQLKIQHENNIAGINAEWDGKEAKIAADKRKDWENSQKEKAKKERDFRKLEIANMAEDREKDLAEADFKYAQDQEKYKGNAKALEELKKHHEAEIAKINSEWDKDAREKAEAAAKKVVADKQKELTKAKEDFAKQLANKKKAIDDGFALQQEANKKAEQADRELLIKGQLKFDQYQQNIKDREAKLNSERKAADDAFNSDKLTATTKFYDDLIAVQAAKVGEEGFTQAMFDEVKKQLTTQKNEEETALRLEQKAKEKAETDAATEERLAQMQIAVDREKAINKAKWDYAEKSARDGLEIVTLVNDNLTKNAKKQNDIQKAVTLVKIGIDSAKAISSAISNANAPTPDNVATGGLAGIAKFVLISAQIASAVAQAHKVLSTGVGSQGGGASAGASAPSISAPQIPAPQFGGTEIQSNQNTPEPIKVYVTEADIRNARNKVNVIEGQSVVV